MVPESLRADDDENLDDVCVLDSSAERDVTALIALSLTNPWISKVVKVG